MTFFTKTMDAVNGRISNTTVLAVLSVVAANTTNRTIAALFGTRVTPNELADAFALTERRGGKKLNCSEAVCHEVVKTLNKTNGSVNGDLFYEAYLELMSAAQSKRSAMLESVGPADAEQPGVIITNLSPEQANEMESRTRTVDEIAPEWHTIRSMGRDF